MSMNPPQAAKVCRVLHGQSKLRVASEFCVIGWRGFQEDWVSDFALLLRRKAARSAAFSLMASLVRRNSSTTRVEVSQWAESRFKLRQRRDGEDTWPLDRWTYGAQNPWLFKGEFQPISPKAT